MTTLRDIIDWDDKTLVRWSRHDMLSIRSREPSRGEPALWLEREPVNGRWMLADEGGTSVPADLDDDAHDVAAEWIGDGIELSYDMPLPIVGETCRDCGLSAVQPRTIRHASNCSRR